MSKKFSVSYDIPADVETTYAAISSEGWAAAKAKSLEDGSEVVSRSESGGGVTLVGPVIKINSGGAPGNGSGAAPILPGAVRPADADKAGELLIQAQKQALQCKQPLCAICEAAKQEAARADS